MANLGLPRRRGRGGVWVRLRRSVGTGSTARARASVLRQNLPTAKVIRTRASHRTNITPELRTVPSLSTCRSAVRLSLSSSGKVTRARIWVLIAARSSTRSPIIRLHPHPTPTSFIADSLALSLPLTQHLAHLYTPTLALTRHVLPSLRREAEEHPEGEVLGEYLW